MRLGILPCQGWGRGFESLRPLQINPQKSGGVCQSALRLIVQNHARTRATMRLKTGTACSRDVLVRLSPFCAELLARNSCVFTPKPRRPFPQPAEAGANLRRSSAGPAWSGLHGCSRRSVSPS